MVLVAAVALSNCQSWLAAAWDSSACPTASCTSLVWVAGEVSRGVACAVADVELEVVVITVVVVGCVVDTPTTMSSRARLSDGVLLASCFSVSRNSSMSESISKPLVRAAGLRLGDGSPGVWNREDSCRLGDAWDGVPSGSAIVVRMGAERAPRSTAYLRFGFVDTPWQLQTLGVVYGMARQAEAAEAQS